MKNILVLGSIFAALIMITMPAISSTNAAKIIDSKEKNVMEQIEGSISNKINEPQPEFIFGLLLKIVELFVDFCVNVVMGLAELFVEIISNLLPS